MVGEMCIVFLNRRLMFFINFKTETNVEQFA
jgi:hypothetical protein